MKVNPTRNKLTVTLKTRRRLRVSRNHSLKQKVRNLKFQFNKWRKIKMIRKFKAMMSRLIAISITKRERVRKNNNKKERSRINKKRVRLFSNQLVRSLKKAVNHRKMSKQNPRI
jgi:hypothetical protein